MTRLIARGAAACREEREADVQELGAMAKYEKYYEPDYLDSLRGEWDR